MDEGAFWVLIDECRRASAGDTDLTARLLFRRLRATDAAAVVAFTRLWERAASRLYSWPVTDAACLLLGAVEEEDLRHIKDWIISYGRAVVDGAVLDPDTLVDLAADAGNARADRFTEFITEAHVVVSGTWPLGHDPEEPDDPVGERTDLSDPTKVRRVFPRLAAFRRDHPEIGEPQLR